MWLLLLPVIVVETWVGVRHFSVSAWRALWAETVANCVSTIVGVPFTWLILALARAAVDRLGVPRLVLLLVPPLTAVWLPPLDQTPAFVSWFVLLAAGAVMTAVFFAVSVVSEHGVVHRMLPHLERKITFNWMIRANVASYVMMVVVFVLGATCAPQVLERINEAFGFATDWLVDSVFWAASAGRK
jgi:hypothetical protein